MQASPAKNETRLPRAVLKRSAAIEERIKARSEPETPDPALPTPVSAQTPPTRIRQHRRPLRRPPTRDTATPRTGSNASTRPQAVFGSVRMSTAPN